MTRVVEHCTADLRDTFTVDDETDVEGDSLPGIFVCVKDAGEKTDVEIRLSPASAMRIGRALIDYAMHGRITDDVRDDS